MDQDILPPFEAWLNANRSHFAHGYDGEPYSPDQIALLAVAVGYPIGEVCRHIPSWFAQRVRAREFLNSQFWVQWTYAAMGMERNENKPGGSNISPYLA